ncbi:protoporphyrinogen oxidase [Streptomyces sp. NPDC048603]|uniref:protoporphyrinogen oxidase n=1 Tax=Streptomyces sp. NPDC048603 TaxID=3365577 RepID=UPI0037208812
MHEADTRTDRARTERPAVPAHVVVVGGGIAGLAAAHRLLASGAQVTLFEASPRLGGKLYTAELAGAPVDLGAESLLARRPEALDLARAVGLGDALQPPATATARLWTRGVLRPMPGGHLMGVPGDLEPLAASGVLSAEGLARARAERTDPAGTDGPLPADVAVGEYVAARLGREVVDRLVEPLLGGVYAGDAYRISMRAAVPALYDALRADRPLTESVRSVQRAAAERTHAIGAAAAGPVFAGIEGGIGRLPLAVAEACRASGARILTGTPVRELTRTAHGWRVTTADGAVTDADAVVLATPAGPAARLLAPYAPAAAAELDAVEYASMALVTLAVRRSELPAPIAEGASSGFLVPPVDGRTVKASTFSGNKWAWNADPELFLLRASVGRHGDEKDLDREDPELVGAALADLGDAVGLTARPVAATVTRWDGGLPQYPVGHLDRVARIRTAVAAVPGLAVCGALYDGVGIPACIASARAAVEALAAVTDAAAGGLGTPGTEHRSGQGQ